MNETFIVERINKIRQQFINEKDGGRVFIKALAKEFGNYDINQRNQVVDFLIRELQVNINGLRFLVLPVLEDMDAKEAASRIYETYLNYLKNDDVKWEKAIVTILFQLRYTEPEDFYSNYINKYIKNKVDNGYIFFLGVLYCRVNPPKALDLLSNYFCKHLKIPNQDMVLFFENRMGFLFNYFTENPVDYIPELIKRTADKSKISGSRLKEIMLHYFHSDLVKDYNKEFIQQRINTLNDINLSLG